MQSNNNNNNNSFSHHHHHQQQQQHNIVSIPTLIALIQERNATDVLQILKQQFPVHSDRHEALLSYRTPITVLNNSNNSNNHHESSHPHQHQHHHHVWNDGNTVLHCSVQYNEMEVVSLMLVDEYGMSPEVVNAHGKTVFDVLDHFSSSLSSSSPSPSPSSSSSSSPYSHYRMRGKLRATYEIFLMRQQIFSSVSVEQNTNQQQQQYNQNTVNNNNNIHNTSNDWTMAFSPIPKASPPSQQQQQQQPQTSPVSSTLLLQEQINEDAAKLLQLMINEDDQNQ